MVRITPFGGCGVLNPLGEFYRTGRQRGLIANSHFRQTAFSLSANANDQLIEFVTGAVQISPWIRKLACGKPVRPAPELAQHILSGEIAPVEMLTLTEFIFAGGLLNVNLFDEVILPQPEGLELGSDHKPISKWKGAPRRPNEDIHKITAENIYYMIRPYTPKSKKVARFVRDTRSRMLDVDEMTKSIADRRDRLGIALALILHDARYRPGGRPAPWPADFKENCVEVAQRLDRPNFAGYVARERADQGAGRRRTALEPGLLRAAGRVDGRVLRGRARRGGPAPDARQGRGLFAQMRVGRWTIPPRRSRITMVKLPERR
jgi:hypothetical protein